MSWHQKLVLIYSSVNNRKQSFTGLWSVAVWYDWTILEISSCQIFAQKKPKYFIFILMDYSKNISLWVITGVSILGNFWKNLGYFIPTFGHTGPCWRWVDVDCLCTFQLVIGTFQKTSPSSWWTIDEKWELRNALEHEMNKNFFFNFHSFCLLLPIQCKYFTFWIIKWAVFWYLQSPCLV